MSNTPAEYVSLTSPALTINDVEITAQSGWAWIGFPTNRSLKVQVINTLGMVVKTLSMAGEEMNFAANFAPGIYTVKIVANDQQLYVEKLIVK